MSFADQIDVFYGRVTHSSAQVYVRVSSLVGGAEWSIAGHVRGPIAPGTRTLPTTVALADLGTGATLLGSCSIPDPAFWTTQLPVVYEVNIQLRRDGKLVETAIRSLGMRFFGASGRNFLWQGKRWVLRGVSTDFLNIQNIDDFRDNAGVLVVNNPSESILDAASKSGVLLAVEPAGGDLLQNLRSLARWPAVAIVILPSDFGGDDDLQGAVPNLLVAERIDPTKAITYATWAQAIVCDATEVDAFRDATKQLPLPIIAERRLHGNYTLLEARRECDLLQRDLATLGDFAGYVVHTEGTSGYKTMRAE